MSDSHRDLIAWQKAMALTTNIFVVTERFPKKEIYGLTRQVRDAVARNVGFLKQEGFEAISAQADEVGRVHNGLVASIQRQMAES